jgi:hypothetical protein
MSRFVGRRSVVYFVSTIGVLSFALSIAIWVRSYWRQDSIFLTYSTTGQVTIDSECGIFSIGHCDPRFRDAPDTFHWFSTSIEDGRSPLLSASQAGFGWYSHGLSDTKELRVRYWVVVLLAVLISAVPWFQWRYSFRTLLIALTALVVMIGFSAASYRQERAAREGSRYKVKVVYDYGKFGNSVDSQVAVALEKGSEFELLSLDSRRYKATPENNFHGWMEYGRTKISDKKVRKQLLAALRGGVNKAEEFAADCFDPRHGIRVKMGGKIYEFVICFECGWTELYIDGKELEGFTVAESPQPELDGILRSAGVELAPSARY